MAPDAHDSGQAPASALPMTAAGRAWIGQRCDSLDGTRSGEIAALLHVNERGHARSVVVAWDGAPATLELLASIRRHP